jgi:crooked neck
LILENWLRFESSELGDSEERTKVEAKLPKRVKKRRRTKVVNQESGQEVTDENAGWEEYYDYLFPDDEKDQQKKSLKILELAHKWKKGAA